MAAPDIPSVDDGAREVRPSVAVPLAPNVFSLVGIPDCWLAVAVSTMDGLVASERLPVGVTVACPLVSVSARLPVGVAVACPPVSLSVNEVPGFKSEKSVLSRDAVGVDKALTTGEAVGVTVGTSSEAVPEALVNPGSGLSVDRSLRISDRIPEVGETGISILSVGIGRLSESWTPVGKMGVDTSKLSEAGTSPTSVDAAPVGVGPESVPEAPGNDTPTEIPTEILGTTPVGTRLLGMRPGVSDTGTFSLLVEAGATGGSDSTPVERAPDNDIPVGMGTSDRPGSSVGRPETSDTGMVTLLIDGNKLSKKLGVRDAGIVPGSVTSLDGGGSTEVWLGDSVSDGG